MAQATAALGRREWVCQGGFLHPPGLFIRDSSGYTTVSFTTDATTKAVLNTTTAFTRG